MVLAATASVVGGLDLDLVCFFYQDLSEAYAGSFVLANNCWRRSGGTTPRPAQVSQPLVRGSRLLSTSLTIADGVGVKFPREGGIVLDGSPLAHAAGGTIRSRPLNVPSSSSPTFSLSAALCPRAPAWAHQPHETGFRLLSRRTATPTGYTQNVELNGQNACPTWRRPSDHPHVCYSEPFTIGEQLLAECEQRGLEGIVSKRKHSPYKSGKCDR